MKGTQFCRTEPDKRSCASYRSCSCMTCSPNIECNLVMPPTGFMRCSTCFPATLFECEVVLCGHFICSVPNTSFGSVQIFKLTVFIFRGLSAITTRYLYSFVYLCSPTESPGMRWGLVMLPDSLLLSESEGIWASVVPPATTNCLRSKCVDSFDCTGFASGK